jgi:hypothetical protein
VQNTLPVVGVVAVELIGSVHNPTISLFCDLKKNAVFDAFKPWLFVVFFMMLRMNNAVIF